MYIEPFWAGVIVTIFTEMLLAGTALFISFMKFTNRKQK